MPNDKKITFFIKLRIAIFILAAFIPATQLFAQVKFYTLVSERDLYFNQTFQVQYVIEGGKNIEQLRVPKMADFNTEEVFDIPNTPSLNPNTMQLVDTYSRIVILSPKRNGQLLIQGAVAVIDGKLIKSNAVKVMVRKSGWASVPDDENDSDVVVEDESELVGGENIDEKIKKNFFLNASVNKTSCYVGEPVMAVYKAYSRLNASSQVVKRPSLTGFSVIEMVEGYDNKPEIENMNGKPFYVHILRKVQLFPLQAGTYDLDEAEVQSVIHFLKLNEDNEDKLTHGWHETLSQPLTSHTTVDYTTTIKTTPVTITVKALPEDNQPAGFSGAVGKFSIHLIAPDKNLRPGEISKLKLLIIGMGNLQLINAPKIEWPEGFEVSETSAKEEANKFVYPLSGAKIFEYNFSSPDTGTYKFAPVKFSFFDPEKKKYRTVETAPFTFSVYGKQYKKKVISIEKAEDFSSPKVPLQWYYFASIIIMIVSWVLYQGILLAKDKKVKELNKPTSVIEQSGKSQIPVDRFGKARIALQKLDKKGFYQELQLALWNVASEKCNVLPSELNKKNVWYILSNCNIPPEVVNRLTDILNECEWALYTPSIEEKNMSDLLEIAEKTVLEILI